MENDKRRFCNINSQSISHQFAGLGRFHILLLITCGLCLMATIVETLNIGFVIPLIEMECELTLSQTNKGLLNGAAFAGEFTTMLSMSQQFLNTIHVLFFCSRCRCELIYMGISRRLGARWAEASDALLHDNRLCLLISVIVLRECRNVDRHEVFCGIFVSSRNQFCHLLINEFFFSLVFRESAPTLTHIWVNFTVRNDARNISTLPACLWHSR